MDTEIKNKNNKVWVITVVLLAVVVVAFIYLRQPQKTQQPENQTQKPQISNELILGQKIESPTALSFPDPEKVDFVQFSAAGPLEELVKFYTKKLEQDGWTITKSSNLGDKNFVISASKTNDRIKVSIVLPPLKDNQLTTVAITYWRL